MAGGVIEALGISALSSIFSIVNAALIRQLPYEEPDRLVLIEGLNLKDESQRVQINYPDFVELQRRHDGNADKLRWRGSNAVRSGRGLLRRHHG